MASACCLRVIARASRGPAPPVDSPGELILLPDKALRFSEAISVKRWQLGAALRALVER